MSGDVHLGMHVSAGRTLKRSGDEMGLLIGQTRRDWFEVKDTVFYMLAL
jgi:hypothetical protein